MRRARLLALCAVAGIAFGCGDVLSLDDVSCPPSGTTLSYENFGQGFFLAYCNECHSAPEGHRQGAPTSAVFDTPEQVRSWRERIFARAAGPNDSMPPGPDDPPRAERDRLSEWLACGAP